MSSRLAWLNLRDEYLRLLQEFRLAEDDTIEDTLYDILDALWYEMAPEDRAFINEWSINNPLIEKL